MKCHACSGWMFPDAFGHPVHDGPCPGYPPRYSNRTDLRACANCGHDLPASSLPGHQKRCTPEAPKPPRPTVPRARCPRCTLYHGAQCPPFLRLWPAAPLVAALWTRVPERTYEAAGEQLGVSAEGIPRPADVLTDERADRWACRIGVHPSLVWPDWFDAAPDPLRDAFLASGWRTAWLHDHPDPQPIPQGQEAAA